MGATTIIDETKILSREEIKDVLDDLKRRARRSVNTRQNLVIFRLSTCCGLRVSEICGLKLGDAKVQLARPYIQVRKGTAKRKKPRRVPLWWDTGTLADLQAWANERKGQGAECGDWFVCSQAEGRKYKGLDRRNARARFISACRVVGEDRQGEITIHTGRHSYVSHALAGGRTLAEVKIAAGHSNISTTSVYVHVAVSDRDNGPGDIFKFDVAEKP